MFRFYCFLFLLFFGFSANAQDIRQELNEIQKQKTDQAGEQKRLLEEIATIEKNLQELSLKQGEKKQQIAQRQEELSRKLPLLARLARMHPFRILVDSSTGQDTLRGIILVRAFTNSLKHEMQQIQAELNEINGVCKELEFKAQSLQQILQNVETQQTHLKTLESQKMEDFKKIELERLALEEDVNTLLDESRAALSEKERSVKDAAALKKLPFRWLEPPVVGKVVNDPILQNKFSPHSQGILFETRKNAEVTAPSQGKIVFKGPFRNQGDILIIDHGTKVYTILMGMHKINAHVGQRVYAGEKLGMMPGYGSGTPKLYLELRKEGKAIDPKPYFIN